MFNPDITKQATEITFWFKNNKTDHPELTFTGIPIAREPFTKHLGVYLDSRLIVWKHIKKQVLKTMKGVSLLKLLSKYVDRNVLDLCHKMYVRPHHDYGDVIYHNQRMDVMDLIECGWELLFDRRWARRLTIYYKINSGHASSYLTDHITEGNEINLSFRNRNVNIHLNRTQRYENSFFRILSNHGMIRMRGE